MPSRKTETSPPTAAPPPPSPATNGATAGGNGRVKVGLPTRMLTREEAEALCFARAGKILGDGRHIAGAARAAVVEASAAAIDALLPPALAKLRHSRHQAALAAKRAALQAAEAEVKQLEAAAPPPPEEPTTGKAAAAE